MSQLLPGGLTLYEAPYPFHNAIRTALAFISWQENLPKDERPPKRIWLDEKALEAHFKAVEKKREDEMKGQNNPEEWSGDMVNNDAASILITE